MLLIADCSAMESITQLFRISGLMKLHDVVSLASSFWAWFLGRINEAYLASLPYIN